MANTCASSRGNTWAVSIIRNYLAYRMRRWFTKFSFTKQIYLVFMKTVNLSFLEVSNTYKIAIKCNQFIRVTISEGNLLYQTDVEAWKCSYRIGLETLVVYTLNYEYQMVIYQKWLYKLTRKYSAWEVQLQYRNLTELAGIWLNGGTCGLMR